MKKGIILIIACVLIILSGNIKSSESYFAPIFSPYLTAPIPLLAYGYPPTSLPLSYGTQPILTLLQLAGLSSYTSLTTGYPYSTAGYDLTTLFPTATSPYPYVSTLPDPLYPYLDPLVQLAPITYSIYTYPLTSTLSDLSVTGLI